MAGPSRGGPALEARELTCAYGERVALDRLTLRAEAGSVHGLLGPNGAGKSTAIGCFAGLVRPRSGSAHVAGHDVVAHARRARSALGVVPQELALYDEISAAENLRFWGAAQGLGGAALERRVAELLEHVGLDAAGRRPVRTFSGGMARRLNFACGVVHAPPVLLLDEPTAGVDPSARARLLELVRAEARRGACVLYTTHYMEEAEALCDRLAILDRGRVVAEGSLEELRRRSGTRDRLRLGGRFDPERARAAVAGLEGVEVDRATADELALRVSDAARALPAVLAALAAAGAEVRETASVRPSLEALFFELVGGELER